MRQRWERLTFLHWAFDPADVAKLLPDGLTPDLHDGMAWVGRCRSLWWWRLRVAGPHLGCRDFPRPMSGPMCVILTGTSGSGSSPWTRPGSVPSLWRGPPTVCPYYWSAMDIGGDDASIAYWCYRRWPGPGTASSRVRIAIGEPYQPDELTELDHFLTARWILFSAAGSRYRLARACHDPWPLHRAEATVVNDTLVRAAGLPVPQGEPLVHYSPGVDVTIGPPERCAGLP